MKMAGTDWNGWKWPTWLGWLESAGQGWNRQKLLEIARMIGNGYTWLGMAVNGWKMLEMIVMAGYCQKQIEMARMSRIAAIGQKWLDMAGMVGFQPLEIAGNCGKWLELLKMAGQGWKWLELLEMPVNSWKLMKITDMG